MTKTLASSLLLILTLVITAAAQDLDPPKLDPTPTMALEKVLIDEGIVLHDRGDYDGAIKKYEEVLRNSPANVLAIYEMAYSLSMKKDYKKSLEMCYRGAKYKSTELVKFYLLIGNNLDLLGEPKKSIEVYKKAIAIAPDVSLLHYNMAITYLNLKNADDAKKSLKKALQLNPDHASSHAALGQIFDNTGYKTPAIIAYLRFLALEPKTERAKTVLQMMRQTLSGGATPGQKPNEINIFVNMNAKKDEGDFGGVDMFLGLNAALAISEKNKGKSEAEILVDQLKSFVGILTEQDIKGDDKSKFVWKYYVPYFAEIDKRDYVEIFIYYIIQQSKLDGVEQWLTKNDARLNEFLAWSKNYQWPKK